MKKYTNKILFATAVVLAVLLFVVPTIVCQSSYRSHPERYFFRSQTRPGFCYSLTREGDTIWRVDKFTVDAQCDTLSSDSSAVGVAADTLTGKEAGKGTYNDGINL